MATVLYQKDERCVGWVTLHRPEKYNAFNAEMIQDLHDCFTHIHSDDTLRAVVLTGSGPSFCAGGDLRWMKESINLSPSENQQDALRLGRALQAVAWCPVPLIVGVQGAVYGGGLGLLACADWAIARPDATFCFSEVKLGLVPALISPFVLRKVSQHWAQRLFLSAEVFDAAKAQHIELIHDVLPSDVSLEAHIRQRCLPALLQQSPQAQRAIKRELFRFQNNEEELVRLATLLSQLRASPEGQEGLQALLERRTPNW